MKNIIHDFLYNALYQMFIIIIPIITLPFLARTLGVEALGINSYTFSIVQILTVISLLGMAQYGVRNIAKVRDSQCVLNSTFWNLWIIQLITGAIVLLGYMLFVMYGAQNYQLYFWLQLPFLISVIFDISWFYMGIEKFKKIVLRNITIKSITLLLIFIVIKNESDLWKYILILSVGNFLGNLVFWVSIKKYITQFVFDGATFKNFFRGAFFLLIPQLCIQLYITFDKTIVGMIAGPIELSYYDHSQKIARIVLTIITSLSIVLLPKMSNLIAKNDGIEVDKILKKSMDYTLVTSIVFCVVVMVNSFEFVPWFFGKEFAPMSNLMFWVSLIIIFIPLGGVFANQYALVFEKDKQFLVPLVIGAVLSLSLNLITVPYLGALGATFVMVVVEFTVCFLRIYLVRKELKLNIMFKGIYIYILLGGIAFFVGVSIPNIFDSVFLNMFIKSLIIFLIYLGGIMLTPNTVSKDIKKLVMK
ncbi:oligosaccharide flippase family protein [Bacillus cereus group sp. BfR-BA-01455]|nr:oligosaccharide flippase family protein [Bacillus cereus group sp. BfR-BA-01455]